MRLERQGSGKSHPQGRTNTMSNQYPQRDRNGNLIPPGSVIGNSPLNPNHPSSQEPRLQQAKKPNKWAPWLGGGLVGLLAGLVIGSAGGSSTTDATSPQPTVTQTVAGPAGTEVTVTPPPVTVTKPGPRTTVTAPPPEAASVMSEDGIYLVGTDIKPGQYKSGPGSDCYWARLSGTGGDLDDIITNHNGGNSIVTIRKTDKAFETARCGEWKRVG